jgi:pyrroline-5-carboxylate reductase
VDRIFRTIESRSRNGATERTRVGYWHRSCYNRVESEYVRLVSELWVTGNFNEKESIFLRGCIMSKGLDKRIGFIGACNKAEAFVRGLLDAELCLASKISVSDVRRERLDCMKDTYGVNTFEHNEDCVNASDIVVLAVKPQDTAGVLDELSGNDLRGKLLLSILAGVTISRIEGTLQGGIAVIRVMPNTPVLIGEGVSVWARGTHVVSADAERGRLILGALGKELEVREDLLNATTAVSGSGPAYVFYLLEAMAMAGRKLGLTAEQSLLLAVQTVIGAGRLAEATRENPEQLRGKVTSPGGTTAAAISMLEKRKVKTAIVDAIEAACKRAAELSRVRE